MRYVLQSVTGLICLVMLTSCQNISKQSRSWHTLDTKGQPTAWHEASLVAHNNKLYLLGGRRVNPVDVYNPATNSWQEKSKTPIEIHHFQAVVLGDAIYMIGAMTGKFPNEKPLDRVLVYYPERDVFEFSHEIPAARRRGGAGTVVYNNKIYVVGGITNGHMDGYRPWLDEYDPQTGAWRVLPDAPYARDHFSAAVVDNKLYAFAGRRSSHRTKQVFDLTIEHGNVFDFNTERWLPVTDALAIPTPRAGTMAFSWNQQIVVGGGESRVQKTAHGELEAFDTISQTWRKWPKLNAGRHGTGLAIIGNYVYTASGSGNRGGRPELVSLERLKLPTATNSQIASEAESREVFPQWHTVTLSFEGPETSERAEKNPFTDYRLQVDFKHKDTNYRIRGFYAADGNAAETSADSGNIWKVRFTPDRRGTWQYSAQLTTGKHIAIDDDASIGEVVAINNARGTFRVIASDKAGDDFRAHGRLSVDGTHFRFKDSGNYWLKGGTNSPENFLAFADFDGTYRVTKKARKNEARAGDRLHHYFPHVDDWQVGDPSWKDGKGKGIIGAINYLSSMGVNSSYFLTMNIEGDGKDVWPFVSHEEFTRFDCSKLDQWEIVFQHLQTKGMLIHLVTQETENELMLDNGDTGFQRKLYYRELISRFGHHLGLIWNLGEENGPVKFSPKGQTSAQQKRMADYLKQSDPYAHPVLIHTHHNAGFKENVLSPLLGHKNIDGLSFQVSERKEVYSEIIHWAERAKRTGYPWLITMDEIGAWHTGTLPDSLDPTHDTLRRYVLWGGLMAGAAGVEWYFGGRHPHNDLTAEDFRERNRIWQLTDYAITFFRKNLPYWKMAPAPELIKRDDSYVLAAPGEVYAIYSPSAENITLDLKGYNDEFDIFWFDPLNGGELQRSSQRKVVGPGPQFLGSPPSSTISEWVAVVKLRRGDLTPLTIGQQ